MFTRAGSRPGPLEIRMRLSVIGCGYLGAVHAACMAKLGHDVIGIDLDVTKIEALAAGTAPFFEPGLPELLTEMAGTGRLRFSADIADARGAEVHFVCVGTPQKKGENGADLSYVNAAFQSLVPHLSDGDLVVGKSTVPVGTARRLAGLIADGAADATLAWNPEFLREGFAVNDTLTPDRLVYGVISGAEADPATGAAGRGVRDRIGRRYAPARRRLRHRRAGQGRRKLVPGHEDQLHQRDGGALRGHRRRCDEARRCDRSRRPDRPTVPQRRSRFRRWLPAQRHPGLHGPGRRARGRRGAHLSPRGRCDQHPAPAAHGGVDAGDLRRIAERSPGGRAGRGVQAGQRRRARLAGAGCRRDHRAARRVSGRDRSGGDRDRTPIPAGTQLRGDRGRGCRRRRCRAAADRMARVPRFGTDHVRCQDDRASNPRRAQRAGPDGLAGGRLGISRAGPTVMTRHCGRLGSVGWGLRR